ncbi:MAG: 4Fe-4S binding protein [Fibrobacter sp.]|nr:4Fe-4S binding protein [Fibrobacter sp.]
MAMYINNLLCVACDKCVETCPSKAITEDDTFYSVNTTFCTECGQCKEVCNNGAIEASYTLGRTAVV